MPEPEYLSTDPNAGQPIGEYLSTDPNAGEPAAAVSQMTPDTQFAADLLIGAGKGAVSTLSRYGELARKYIPGVSLLDKLFPPIPVRTDTDNTVQAIGKGAEQIAEVLVPSRAVTSAGMALSARLAPKLAPVVGKTVARVAPRAAVEAAGSAAIAAGQGGDPTTAGVIGAALPAVGATAGKVASTLKKGALAQTVKALGPTKERYKAMAERLAPAILKRGLGGSRETLQAKSAQMAEAVGEQIDDAIAKFGDREVKTQAVLDALETAKDTFRTRRTVPMAQAINERLTERAGARVVGNEVEIPVVFDQRPITQLEKLKQVITELGDDARVDQLIAVRRAWDKVVDQAGGFAHRTGGAIGIPLREQQEAWAKREATGAIRKLLDTEVPELSKINKEYAFWKSLDDVLTQTMKRTQPQGPGLGRQVAEAAGAAAGSSAGVGAAFGLAKLTGMASSVFRSPRWRLVDARLRDSLAESIASGKTDRIATALGRISAVQGSKLSQAASQ